MNDIIKTTENKIIGKLSTAIITGTLVAITGAALFGFLDGIKSTPLNKAKDASDIIIRQRRDSAKQGGGMPD